MRPFAVGDTHLVARVQRDPRVAFWRKKQKSVREIRADIKSSILLNKYALGWWLLFDRRTGQLVGTIMLQPLKATFEIEIGYHLLLQFRERGYGSEAAGHLLMFGFEVLGLTRIRAVVLPRNRPSLRIMEKLGFVQRGALWHAGLFHRYFVLERQDYLARKHRLS